MLTPLPAGASGLYAKLDPRVPARLRPWIAAEAQRLASGQSTDLTWPSPNDPQLAGQQLTDASIEALTFIVMMEATKSAQEDLKSIMDQVRAENAAKQQLRQLLSQVNSDIANNAGRKTSDPCVPPSCGAYLSAPHGAFIAPIAAANGPTAVAVAVPSPPATIGGLNRLQDGLKSKLDSMNELGETESVRLQMMMDRRAKFIETLSNVMKKISSTSDAILQNLK